MQNGKNITEDVKAIEDAYATLNAADFRTYLEDVHGIPSHGGKRASLQRAVEFLQRLSVTYVQTHS